MKKSPTIILEQKVHRKENQLLVRFTYHDKLIALIRSVKGAYWSTSLNSWYLKYSQENLDTILSLFKDITEVNISKINKTRLFKRN